MDVYLVPVGPDRHELYCEVTDDPEEAEAGTGAPEPLELESARRGFFRRVREPLFGFFRRLRERFSEMLAEAERDRRQARAATVQSGWMAFAKARMMRWVAESIAEQRLLWLLRRQTDACLFYPDDLDEAQAVAVLRAQLTRDFDKHRFWLAIDSVLVDR